MKSVFQAFSEPEILADKTPSFTINARTRSQAMFRQCWGVFRGIETETLMRLQGSQPALDQPEKS
jgi:hypothetical protein